MAKGLEALLTLPKTAISRVALLKAIDDLGSISAAARAADLSYKGAWDAVQALNNLFEAPLVVAAPGGKSGGAARLTEQGRAVVAAFARVETEMAAVRSRLGAASLSDPDLGWSLGMRTSARNALRGRIVRVAADRVTSEVVLRLGSGHELSAVVTRESVETLGLRAGLDAIALIKSSFVSFTRDGPADAGGPANRLSGRVLTREDGDAHSEVRLELGQGKTLAATLARSDADALQIRVGDALTARFEPSHVILAVE